jgi:hypothetical protein
MSSTITLAMSEESSPLRWVGIRRLCPAAGAPVCTPTDLLFLAPGAAVSITVAGGLWTVVIVTEEWGLHRFTLPLELTGVLYSVFLPFCSLREN